MFRGEVSSLHKSECHNVVNSTENSGVCGLSELDISVIIISNNDAESIKHISFYPDDLNRAKYDSVPISDDPTRWIIH